MRSSALSTKQAGELRRRDAGGLDIHGESDTPQPSARRAFGATAGKAVPVAGGEKLFEDIGKVAAVVGRADRRGIRHRLGRDKITAADFVACQAQSAGSGIGESLQNVAGFRPAGAPICVRGHGVGEHAGHLDMDRGCTVYAGEQRGIDRAGDARAERRDIGAHVGERLYFQPQEFAVLADAERRPGRMVAGLSVGQESLGAR